MLDKKIIRITQELGTADFIVHHIHAFTIHVTLLILSKGVLYARNSRFVSDKLELGFTYPCDGPGRGGTCQISPWDHLFSAVFWMYNCLNVVTFHYFWKMQSDVWGFVSIQKHISHYSQGDFSVNSITINGWLRNLLWSEASQVIQSYALSSICPYGFIFLIAHFIWAFSLMFLFSGRAYWQELIESILWSHHKLKIIPHIQPRALSISQGRAVGFIHYTLGGIGSTWAFHASSFGALVVHHHNPQQEILMFCCEAAQATFRPYGLEVAVTKKKEFCCIGVANAAVATKKKKLCTTTVGCGAAHNMQQVVHLLHIVESSRWYTCWTIAALA